MDATPGDALGIIKVFHDTWLATYPNKEHGVSLEDIEYYLKDDFSMKEIETLEQNIKDMPSNRKRLVAKIGNTIVGTCTAMKNEDYNHVRALYVLPEFQNNKIGVMLWNKADEFFDHTKDTIVQVAEYTEQAIHFYKKLGFIDTGKRIQDESERLQSGSIIIDMEMIKKARCR